MSETSDPQGTSRRLHAIVTGRVQGVGFRYSTAEVASRLRLAGWVRNLSDGDVELEAEGPAADLEKLLAFLREGPPMAHVDGVAVDWLPSAAALPLPFEVRRTF